MTDRTRPAAELRSAGPRPTIDVATARRLAVVRAGLADPRRTGLPARARGDDAAARAAAHAVIGRFGYLQLDTVSVAGARSHTLVLLARLAGFDPSLGERLLVPGAPLFEYWGHEACWMPLELWPAFAFRRERFRRHPWWGDVIGPNRALADDLIRRARDDGGFRASDLEGRRGAGWWNGKAANRVAAALWSSGDLAIRERTGFQRIYDLPERVVPDAVRSTTMPAAAAHRELLLRALDGHGWAEARTLAATWRLRPRSAEFTSALADLADAGEIVACDLVAPDDRRSGWIRPRDLDAAARLRSWRPRRDRGVLLSPFDPLLWDRDRLRRLFGFDYTIGIYTPAARRTHGYYPMPVLAGDRLVARVDLKADRAAGRVHVLDRKSVV